MNVLELFQAITTFVFDVDGVLTDGMVYVMPEGVMVRRMNVKDGYALQLAVKQGYRVLVISGGHSPEVQLRLQKLGVTDVYTNVKDKKQVLDDFISRHDLSRDEILFMGDDIPDLEVMNAVGLPTAPADAVTEIRQIAKYVSPLNGGYGCARDVIEKVLKLRNDWRLDTHIKSR